MVYTNTGTITKWKKNCTSMYFSKESQISKFLIQQKKTVVGVTTINQSTDSFWFRYFAISEKSGEKSCLNWFRCTPVFLHKYWMLWQIWTWFCEKKTGTVPMKSKRKQKAKRMVSFWCFRFNPISVKIFTFLLWNLFLCINKHHLLKSHTDTST
jgi:hypothetical protein